MTIKEIANQINDLSVAGYINGIKMSKSDIKTMFTKMLSGNSTNYIFEIALPDGRWLAEVYRVPNLDNMYDYYIPDTREQEDRLFEKLMNKSR